MRLIDANALYCRYQDEVCNSIACCECQATDVDGNCKLDRFITTAPTIDAVSVVRCKECRYKDMEICPMYRLVVAGVRKYDDFCSYGEREDE